jgi:hypothetical protein
MNKRIKELVKQAGLEFDNDSALESEPIYYITQKDLEKFAELIVKECLEQIDKIRDGCESDNEDQQALGADWAGLAVARHFGVEE